MDREHETTWQRYMHKFKQQPLIPLGVFATCVALVGATRKMQAGDRNSFNRWLRFRIIAQGATVSAAVVGGWQIAQERKAAREEAKQSGSLSAEEVAKIAREEERFTRRMKEAEEAHRLETEDVK